MRLRPGNGDKMQKKIEEKIPKRGMRTDRLVIEAEEPEPRSGSGRGKMIALTAAGAGVAGAALAMRRRNGSTYGGSLNAIEAIDIDVPATTAYNQWTQFEQFPQFMSGVEEIQQRDDRHMHWRTNIGGHREEFDAVITEQVPDQRIAWRSTSGPRHAGVVTFHHLDDHTSRVVLQMDAQPSNIKERVGVALGVMDGQVTRDLKNFKQFIESRGTATGAWRGELEHRSDG